MIKKKNKKKINLHAGMNGVPAHDEYVTIHVTPEPEFCYVSFEKNNRRGCLYEQTKRVLELYRQVVVDEGGEGI